MDTDTSVAAMPKQLDILDFWLVRLVHQALVLFKELTGDECRCFCVAQMTESL